MKTPNGDLRSKYIDVAKQYVSKILSPGNLNLIVNVYISGSVSYGYCDELSDLEMEFYFPDGTEPAVIKKADQSINALPEFMGIRMSAGISEWGLEKIISGDVDDYWEKYNPYTLYEISTALPIREDVPLLERAIEKISFYPKRISDMVVRGLWLTIIDSGAYNADYSYKRNDRLISGIFLSRAVEALLRLAYIANRKYYPHTKWLAKGISTLPLDFGLNNFNINFEDLSLNERIASFNSTADKIGTYLVEKGMLGRKYKENAWEILKDKYFIFNTF
jgi:hypothetical protein